MQIGISTASYYARAMTEEAIRIIGEAGSPICEVFLDTFTEYESGFADLCAETAAEYRMKIVSVHAMSSQFEPQLFSLGLRQRQDAQRTFAKVLESARRMGASHYVFHGPALLRGALKNAQMSRIGTIATQLAEFAGDYGVKLCWENVSWCMFDHPTFAEELLSVCNSDNLYFTLDIKQAVRAGHDPFAFLSAMGSRLAHVHMYDYERNEAGVPTLRMPGKGSFDFDALARALGEIGYRGDAVVEVYSDDYDSTDEVRQSWQELCHKLRNL